MSAASPRRWGSGTGRGEAGSGLSRGQTHKWLKAVQGCTVVGAGTGHVLGPPEGRSPAYTAVELRRTYFVAFKLFT